MEGNVCDFSNLDEGVLIPPRKRLLAGFKKQNSSYQSSESASASPPSTGTETYSKNLMGSHSLEEIAENSNNAALAAAKVAETARAVAEEKAAIAAKAIAAAKTALDLVAAFYEETPGRDSRSKKNKFKRPVTVHSSYEKHDEVENESTDEEQLHRVIYRTPGFSKHSSPSSIVRSYKHKRPKISHVVEKTKIPNGVVFERDSCDIFNGDATLDIAGSSWRMDSNDIITRRIKARKQLIRMVER